MANSNPVERYERLGMRESLPREHRYPTACRDLSFILRGAYDRLPKHLKPVVAFRLLPELQKKTLAVMEFKRAKIVYKKQCKMRQESSDSAQLPKDVLLHVVGFLDFQSIISASRVCWSWNVAAHDNSVWQSQCMRMFVAGVNDKMEHKLDKLCGLI